VSSPRSASGRVVGIRRHGARHDDRGRGRGRGSDRLRRRPRTEPNHRDEYRCDDRHGHADDLDARGRGLPFERTVVEELGRDLAGVLDDGHAPRIDRRWRFDRERAEGLLGREDLLVESRDRARVTIDRTLVGARLQRERVAIPLCAESFEVGQHHLLGEGSHRCALPV
jgi:hypothetical protein